ncbi:hypothetical protein GWI33_010888 [Rhynchophorus ferrugineus]|uniref:Uncharacterized protein n=1 Tax=Rhynchophorus ferrugineus TaxID=354439 RepID=A0A834M8V7_RHYFE|nr:hypothetical protein GWI33_010888 [Rhynchophorus ferrugineus]
MEKIDLGHTVSGFAYRGGQAAAGTASKAPSVATPLSASWPRANQNTAVPPDKILGLVLCRLLSHCELKYRMSLCRPTIARYGRNSVFIYHLKLNVV